MSLQVPVAIVGLGCRFPGAPDPGAFWRLLAEGRDAIRELPDGRWRGAAVGGFLEQVDRFDPAFFKISPREAAQVDPQQRLLLEVAYEALCDAGLPVDGLAGTATGVFMASSGDDYARMQLGRQALIDAHSTTGTLAAIAANRISYAFDLRGPSLVVDTACSGSLVAVHLAARSLACGESSLALAGGVSLVLAPERSLALAKLKALSPGRACRAFGADADGYVRGEGAGVVVLKRLEDALAAGDPIYAVIRGSAVNQDGRSNGLTAPNPEAQEALVREACRQAGVPPAALDYVEAHGTGTPLGDPIEAGALGRVLAADRDPARPCGLGSVKSNIGHLEPAAGVAGLLKVALALHHEALPPTLHAEVPNPHIPFEALPLRLVRSLTPWARGERARLAGVSAFSVGGTNAHLIVSEAPARPARPDVPPPVGHLLPLSAHSRAALLDQARAFRGRLADGMSAAQVAGLCDAAGRRRAHLDHRLAVVGDDAAALARALEACVEGTEDGGLAGMGRRPNRSRRLVWVYSGHGGQWEGMGRALLAEDPVFAAAIADCEAAMQPHVAWSLSEVLASGGALGRVEVAQPVIFAVQVAFTAMLRAWGLSPDLVVGHSVGEVAAAHAAGILSLADAALVVCARSRLLAEIAGQGAMAMVELDRAGAEQLAAAWPGELEVAATNSPRASVLAGTPAAVDEALAVLAARGGFGRRVNVDVASHSIQTAPLGTRLAQALTGIVPMRGHVAMRSTVTGGLLDGAACDAAYWARNLREPVRFREALEGLDPADDYLEVGPHPVLAGAIAECLPGAAVLPTGRRDEGRLTVLAALGALYARGRDVAWQAVQAERERVALPPYPWQRERCWLAEGEPRAAGEHPLLARSMRLGHQPGGRLWEGEASLARLGYVEDHRVHGVPVLPGLAYVELVISALRRLADAPVTTLVDVAFHKALLLAEGERRTLQLAIDGPAACRIASFAGEADEPVLHASASWEAAEPLVGEPLADLRARLTREEPRERFYASLARRGYDFGPGLTGVQAIWHGAGELLARVTPPAGTHGDLAGYAIHPGYLDAAMHATFALFNAENGTGEDTYLPVAIARLQLVGLPPGELWSHIRLLELADGHATVAVRAYGADGRMALAADGVRLKCVERRTQVPAALPPDWLYERAWEPASPGSPSRQGAWLVVDDGPTGAEVVAGLAAVGRPATLVPPARVAGWLASAPAPAGIAYLAGLAADDSATAQAALEGLLVTLQAADRAGVRPAWLVATRRAWAVEPGEHVNPFQAPLWGFGLSLWHELAPADFRLVDVALDEPDEAAEAIAREIGVAGLAQLAVRQAGRFEAHLRRPAAASMPLPGRLEGSYLLAGGLGGLGRTFASRLAALGARALVFVGRGELDAGQASYLEGLRATGVTVRHARADVADPAALEGALVGTLEGLPPLRGVIHAAGVLDDGMATSSSPDRLAGVLRPKLAGAWALHELTRGHDLDFFVLCSSASALLGSAGQASYAAANAFLDALAQHRRQAGLPAVSLAYGPWTEVGLAASREDRGERLAALGIGGLSPEEGARALVALAAGPHAQVGVVRVDWPRWAEAHAHLARARYFAGLAEAVAAPSADATDLRTYLPRVVARILRIKEAALDHERPLAELGLDSLMAVELRTRLLADLGVELRVIKLLQCRGLTELFELISAAGPASEPEPELDLAAEAWAVADAVLPACLPAPGPAAGGIFLTGASGFLGAYLLRELLDGTPARVYCLVRAEDEAAGAGRLRAQLAGHGLWRDGDGDRLVPVCGDLGQPRFGLAQAAFADLAGRVDAIYHSGAYAHHIYPYAMLADVNVRGCGEILRLAVTGPIKHVHHVSTLSVFASPAYAGSTVDEGFRVAHGRGLGSGYTQTKWAGERVMAIAADRGVPVTIYRPGFISGNQADGAANLNDMLARFLKGCVELGAAPEEDVPLDLLPVDFVARAIVAIGTRETAESQAYHLFPPEPSRWGSVLAAFRARGFDLAPLPYASWKRRLVEVAGRDPRSAMFPLLPQFDGEAASGSYWDATFRGLAPRAGIARTAARLAELGLAWPVLDRAGYERYLAYMEGRGYLPGATPAT